MGAKTPQTTDPSKEPRYQLNVYHWSYDDKSWGVAVRDTSREGGIDRQFLRVDQNEELSNKRKMKLECQAIQKQSSGLPHEVKLKRIKLPVGIKATTRVVYLEKEFKKKKAKDLWADFESVLVSCGNNNRDQVLRFVLILLSGICVRRGYPYLKDKKLSVENKRGLTVYVTPKEGVNETVRWLVNSFYIKPKNTKRLKMHLPAYLPDAMGEMTIENSAYIQVKKGEKPTVSYRFPAQYRDNCVGISCQGFTQRIIEDFRHHNPWATLVLTNGKKNVLPPVDFEVDGEVFAHCNYSWKFTEIKTFSKCFATYYEESEDTYYKKIAKKTECIYQEYKRISCPEESYPPLVCFQEKLLLYTALVLFEFCCEHKMLPKEKRDPFFSEMINVILPHAEDVPTLNVLSPVDTTIGTDERPIDWKDGETADGRLTQEELLKRYLCKILTMENITRFKTVRGTQRYEPCPTKIEGQTQATGTWGYIDTLKVGSDASKCESIVVFHKKVFKALCTDYGMAKKQLSHAIVKPEDEISFLHPVFKKSMTFEKAKGSKSYDVLAFYIEKLTFLDSEILESFKQAAQTEKTEDSQMDE